MKKMTILLGCFMLFATAVFAGHDKPMYEKYKRATVTVSVYFENNLSNNATLDVSNTFSQTIAGGTSTTGTSDYEDTEGCYVTGSASAAALLLTNAYVEVYSDGVLVHSQAVYPSGLGRPGRFFVGLPLFPTTSIDVILSY